MLRVAHKSGESTIKKREKVNPEVQEFINLFLAEHNAKFKTKAPARDRGLSINSAAR